MLCGNLRGFGDVAATMKYYTAKRIQFLAVGRFGLQGCLNSRFIIIPSGDATSSAVRSIAMDLFRCSVYIDTEEGSDWVGCLLAEGM